MNHYHVWAQCSLVVQDPGKLSPGEHRNPQHHNFHILLSCCGLFGAFQGYLAESSGVTICILGHVSVAVAVLVIVGKSHLPGNDCAEHCWVGHLLCIVRGLQSSVGEILSVVRWACDLCTGKYLQLFHCDISHHGTSVKVQNAWCT